MITPIEVLTQEYLDDLKQEIQFEDNEIKDRILEAASVLIALYLHQPKTVGYNFRFPKSADIIFAKLREDIKGMIELHNKNAITLSRLKNQNMFGVVIKQPEISGWLKRKIQDRTLSNRINRYVQMYKMEVEARLAMGIVEGDSQISLVRSIKKYLEHPYDNLIVKKKSDWKTRRLAVKFKTGSGNYKSAFSNFKRLISDEVNFANKRADFVIWNGLNEVVGIMVVLGKGHPKVDMCDDLVGMYPKEFFFTGWHPSCLCQAYPITKGERVRNVPSRAKEYMGRAKSHKDHDKLQFVTENKKFWR